MDTNVSSGNGSSGNGSSGDGIDGRRLAVVTGASSGIGLSLARQFAENGFDLIVAAEDEGIRSAGETLQSLGARVETVQTDLATEEGVEELARTLEGRDIDAVAINAGVGVGGDFRETDLQAELRLIDLNCRSTVHLAKRIIPQLTERGEGRILFTASVASVMPAPFEAVYGASKAFVYSFAEALRNELKDTGITITALMPGPTETNFFHRAGMDDTKVGVQEKDDPDQVARDGFEALMAGKDHVVAGSLKNKMQAAATKVMPEQMKAEMHRGMAEPGSAENVQQH